MQLGESTVRHSALDLSRFLAALVVFVGHFVWFDDRLASWREFNFLELFRTGNQSVHYFFALSGFVLSISTSRINANWFLARLARLMPVYVICFVSPLIFLQIMAPEEIDSYSRIGLLLGLIGIQAAFVEYYMVGANSPLWSLSVELWLSFVLLFLNRLNKNYLLVLMAIVCEVINHLIFQPVLNGLTFFLIGILIHRLRSLNHIHKPRFNLVKYTLGFLVSMYWIIFPLILELEKSNRIIDLLGVTTTLLFFSKIHLKGTMQKIAFQLGARSYSLYASHGPLLRVHSEIFDEFWKNSLSEFQIAIYVVTCLIVIAIGTEIIYRFVEMPAINLARNLRRSKKY